jgi:hypothetical protein
VSNWTRHSVGGSLAAQIQQELKIMKENSHIDKNTFDYLKRDKPKAGRFYLLPKIHKVKNPGRLVPGLSTCFDAVIMWDASV